MSSVRQLILDLLFPLKCPFCNRPVKEFGPCSECLSEPIWAYDEEFLGPHSGIYVQQYVYAGIYKDDMRQSLLRFKFVGRKEYSTIYGPILARTIQRNLAGSYDCITWIPVSKARLKERGYDQAQLLAQETAKALDTQAVSLLYKTRHNIHQSSLGRAARQVNAEDLFAVSHPEQVAGQRILLIDDIYTTGATLESAAKVLLEAGAVHVLGAAMAHPRRKK